MIRCRGEKTCASINHCSSSGTSDSWDAITSWSPVVQILPALFIRLFPVLNHSPEFGGWGTGAETKLELASTLANTYILILREVDRQGRRVLCQMGGQMNYKKLYKNWPSRARRTNLSLSDWNSFQSFGCCGEKFHTGTPIFKLHKFRRDTTDHRDNSVYPRGPWLSRPLTNRSKR